MRERDCRANYSSVSRYKRRTVRTRCDPDAARWATLFPHVPLARVPCASKLSNPFQRYRTRIHLLLDPIQPIWSAVVGALQRGAASVASMISFRRRFWENPSAAHCKWGSRLFVSGYQFLSVIPHRLSVTVGFSPNRLHFFSDFFSCAIRGKSAVQ